ncbi:MAG: glycosyltransferase [Candidatus Micrarchaeia archaeon]
MNIAFFTETYLPNTDGVVTSILTTRRALEEMGHEVYIFCAGSRKAKKANQDPKVFYHLSTPFKPYPAYRIAVFPFLSERKVKKLGVEMVHTHGMATMGLSAVQTARMHKLPLVGTFHTLIPKASHYVSKNKRIEAITQRILWGYLKWYFCLCDVVIAPSPTIERELHNHGIRKTIVVPTGIDTERFCLGLDRNRIRKELGLEDKVMVLNIGRMVLEKNLDVLIKASLIIVEEIPDAHFVLAGSGPAFDYYRNLVRSMKLDGIFTFTGIIPSELVPYYYAAADVFVFPSKFETQGIVALESMGCGTPVAGADYLAIKDLVKDGYNGYLFDPDDPEDCAEKVIRTIREREKLVNGARKTAEDYSYKNCVAKLVKVYEDLLSKRQ